MTLLKSAAVQSAAARLVGLYLHLVMRTTRWTVRGEQHLDLPAGQPVIASFWHDRLPSLPILWVYMRRHGATGEPRVLVSRHRDGRFIAAAVRRFGVRAVHGSTAKPGGGEKGGAAGLRALLAELQAGQHVLITPDGPRGPPRHAQPGVAQLAALSGAWVLPVATQIARRWTLPTWDRMGIPVPLSRGALVCGAPIAVPRQGWEALLPAIAAAMTAAADQADALCAR